MSKPEEVKEREKIYEVKIALLGDAGVGKSSLVQRFCNDKFDDKYKNTIGGAFLLKEVSLKNGDTLKLQFWDTGGQERFRSMASLYYKDASAAILVYDITNQESFNSMEYWINELNEKIDNDKFLIAVAGNKSDLPPDERKVKLDDAKIFMKEKNVPLFNETSAKIGSGVKELFTNLAQKIYEEQKERLVSMDKK